MANTAARISFRAVLAAGPVLLWLVALAGGGGLALAAPGAAEILQARGCIACHVIPGVPNAVGVVGPSLKGLNNRARIAGGRLENSTENLRDWLKDPKGIKSDTMMPNLGLSDAEIDVLLKFFETL